ncbi:MAG: flagellar hook-length control protein FliK [Zhongshania sp.]|uniref:flagellar hook-length control protein FliK n=1 Tax=Zhongshania sp. TaxID=1971902 RepID=UPI002623B930|nr:flagellar hook-length control protein FliK [Zhongshania sp.]MDF1690914.1 flagellar hook-length control protein FliK [Zhongshania sp.]
MPSSSLPALSSSDVNQQSRASVKAANSSDSASQLPFNQLLAGKMGDAANPQSTANAAVDTDQTQVAASDADDAASVLLLNDANGKALPLTGKELPIITPLVTAGNELTDAGADLDAENALVNWQQVQIDWSRTQLGTGKGLDDASLSAGNRGQQAVDQLLLQQEKLLQGENQAKSNLLLAGVNSQGSQAAPAGGFAAALQGAVAAGEGLGLAQAKGQQSESFSVDEDFADLAALSQLKGTLTSANGAAPRAAVTLTMNQSLVDNPAWGQAMAARIGMMMNNGVHTATMQLNPAELGSIHIQLSMHGDNTSVQFQTQNGDTSDLIEKMLPRLHSGLEQQGLRLDEVKISHNPNLGNGTAANGNQQFAGESAGQGEASSRGSNSGLANSGGHDDELAAPLDMSTLGASKLAVDYYA